MTTAPFAFLPVGAIFSHAGNDYEKISLTRAENCSTLARRNFARFDNVETLQSFLK